MAKHRIQLKDIAKQLGINVATVSKALKDYPDISDKTKERVRALAKELNYLPDTQAGALRGKKSYVIGLIVPEVVHYFFSNVINGIMNYVEENSYRLLITLSNNSVEREEKQLKLLFGNRVDGILVSLANETFKPDHFNFLSDYEIPVVLFDKVDDHLPFTQVIVDDEQGGYAATMHLIRRGCRKIAHIRGPQNPSNSIKRFEGYKRALKEMNIPYEPDLVKECVEVVYDEGYQYTKELLKLKGRPDGIFAVTDQVGVGAVNAVMDSGFSVPDDVKVVGFSDSQIAQTSRPSLTTIHQPAYQIGETAARLLIEEIDLRAKNASQLQPQKAVLETRLIKREST